MKTIFRLFKDLQKVSDDFRIYSSKGIFNCQKYIAEEKMKSFTARLSKYIFVKNSKFL